MEEQKKNNTQGNGQRISVRPGNFNPPADSENRAAAGSAPGANTPPRQGNPNNHRGNRRNRKNRGNGSQPQVTGDQTRGISREQAASDKQNRAENQQGRNTINPQQNRAPGNSGNPVRNPERPSRNQGVATAKATAQTPGEKPAQKVLPPKQTEQKQGGQGRKNKHRRPGNAERQQPQKPVVSPLSDSLQKELDEEFNTPTLSSYTTYISPGSAGKKTAEPVENTTEFEVDIATAAYLTEDIPSGFPAPDCKSVEVVGVRFRNAGKIYFFSPNGLKFAIGDSAIVDTARGPELGDIVMLNRRIAEKEIVQPLRAVIRRATKEDTERNEANHAQEAEALRICAEKIAAHNLDMRLVDAQYSFDNSKLLFYFTSEGRVDFRELVRDLAGVFHTRIELRQIGIRDESRLIGGLGMCGRPFCCATFLSDFGQVSVKMAKEQGLSINTSKISGCCGRLMCCLRYEYETYQAETRLTPKKDTVVETPDGTGTVVDSTPLSGLLKVRLHDLPEDNALRVYHRDDVTSLGKAPARKKESPADEPKNTDAPIAPASVAPAEDATTESDRM